MSLLTFFRCRVWLPFITRFGTGTIGLLMHTRGLLELVVLNIGLQLGVLSPLAFSMLVVMAIVTTVITVPAVYLLSRAR